MESAAAVELVRAEFTVLTSYLHEHEISAHSGTLTDGIQERSKTHVTVPQQHAT